MEKSVLIMGGSYFIGKKIVEIMLEEGYEVYTLNRGTKEENDLRIKQIKCDRNNRVEMYSTLNHLKVDTLIDISGVNKEQLEILTEAIDCKYLKHFIFISSSAVYDVENLSIPYAENDQVAQNKYWTSYGQNKIDAENYLIEKFKVTQTQLGILRPPYVYGENNYAPRETFIFEHIENNKPIIMPKQGTAKLQFIYVDDLAKIVLKLIQKESLEEAIYNVGNRDYLTIKEWISICEEVVGKKGNLIEYDYIGDSIGTREFFPFIDYDNVLDTTKINTIINAETNFREGMKRTYKWYLKEKSNLIINQRLQENEQKILKELNYFI